MPEWKFARKIPGTIIEGFHFTGGSDLTKIRHRKSGVEKLARKPAERRNDPIPFVGIFSENREWTLRLAQPVWRGKDDAGERFWIFRSGDGEDAATGSHRWFLHGIFG